MSPYEFLIILSSLVGVVTFVIATAGWSVKKWIQTQFENNVNQLLPKLINDDTSVARYAHQARDAATEAKDAALDARDAAMEAKKCVTSLRDVLYEIHAMIKDRGKVEIGDLEKCGDFMRDASIDTRDVRL